MTETCGTRASLGSVCVEASGHDGEHRSRYGFTWTDEGDRRAADALAREMEGKRD